MFDKGFTVISKSGNAYKVLSRSGTQDLIPQAERPKPVKKVATPKAPKPVKKTTDRDLVRFVEEAVAEALDGVMRDDPVGDLRDAVSGLADTLDSAEEKVSSLNESDEELRDQTVGLLDEASAVMKFAGIPSGGMPPMNVDDAAAASLARRRGR